MRAGTDLDVFGVCKPDGPGKLNSGIIILVDDECAVDGMVKSGIGGGCACELEDSGKYSRVLLLVVDSGGCW